MFVRFRSTGIDMFCCCCVLTSSPLSVQVYTQDGYDSVDDKQQDGAQQPVPRHEGRGWGGDACSLRADCGEEMTAV